MLEVNLLGQFEILRDGKHLTISTRNAQSLFAYLLLNAGKAYRREKLAGLLWPDSSEENARSNLRHELWRLRKALGDETESYFLIDDLTIAFNSQSQYTLDLHKLENPPLEGSTTDELIAALSNFRGELLPGFYDEWVSLERERLVALIEAKMGRLLELLQSEGRWREVLEWGTRWITMGGWPEPAFRALISAYASSGDLSKAVATYDRLSQGLQKDLGVKPSGQTQALYHRVKAGWKVDGQSESPAPGNLPLVNIPAPKFALPKVRSSNLPKHLTSFIGREKEIQQVEQILSKSRLVTIIGSGGVGKTRLAIQLASTLASEFKDGLWWAELASLFEIHSSQNQDRSHHLNQSHQRGSWNPLAGPGELVGVDLVAQAVAKAMQVPDLLGRPVLEGIIWHLHDKKLLLVLDNCEHLIDACAAFADFALGECPQVKILATSREALGVPGEKTWLVPCLSLPERGPSGDTRNIFQSEAVKLFIERTADVLPDYRPGEVDAHTIAQICQRLDGIPLAIELAAARMTLLSVQEIAARLDRRFSLLTGGRRTALHRHQTLQAAIEWSYDLLSGSEQTLLRRLSVFNGSFTLEAAEAVCAGEEIHTEIVLTLLGKLLDKSLLNIDPVLQGMDLATRYRFLDTICIFGRLKLEEAEEIRLIRDRHAGYYVRLVEAAEPELLLQDQVRWFKLLQAEQANIREVIEWCVESDQADSALGLVGGLLWFWFSYGSCHEGRDMALKALSSPSAVQFTEKRVRALNTAGFLQGLLGETAPARRLLEEAITILRKTNDQASLAWSLQFLGLVLTSEGEYDLADEALQEGLEITRKLGGLYANNFLHFLGDIDLQKGDHTRAKKIYEESASILRAFGSKSFLAYPLRRLGYLALEQNDTPVAWEYFEESLILNREIGDKRALAACMTAMAALALRMGKPELAATLYGVVERNLDLLSIKLLTLDQIELDLIRSKLPSYLEEGIFSASYAEGWGMNEEQVIERLHYFEGASGYEEAGG